MRKTHFCLIATTLKKNVLHVLIIIIQKVKKGFKNAEKLNLEKIFDQIVQDRTKLILIISILFMLVGINYFYYSNIITSFIL
jgi:hypothetical protein